MFIHMLLYTYGKTFSPQVDEQQCKYEEKGDLLVRSNYFKQCSISCCFQVCKWKWKWSHSVVLFATLWTIVHQAPPSMGFSRQEYWSGLLFPSPGVLPDPGIEPRSRALQTEALTSEPTGKPQKIPRIAEVSIFKSEHLSEGLRLQSIRWVHFFLLSHQQIRTTEDLPPVKHRDIRAVISYLSVKMKRYLINTLAL